MSGFGLSTVLPAPLLPSPRGETRNQGHQEVPWMIGLPLSVTGKRVDCLIGPIALMEPTEIKEFDRHRAG